MSSPNEAHKTGPISTNKWINKFVKNVSKRDIKANNIFSLSKIHGKGTSNLHRFFISQNCIKNTYQNNLDFLSIEITSHKTHQNDVHFLSTQITSKKKRRKNVNSSSISITLKKVRRKDIDFRSLKLHRKSTWK